MPRSLAALIFVALFCAILAPALKRDPVPAVELDPVETVGAPTVNIRPELQAPDLERAVQDPNPGLPSELPAPPAAADPCAELRARVTQLERRLAVVDGPVQRWKALLRPGEVPDDATLLRMAQTLVDYPIDLRVEEGLWVAERVRCDDWLLWGRTIDEALVTFLGQERLRRELGEERYQALVQ